jgi:hypothetical protein
MKRRIVIEEEYGIYYLRDTYGVKREHGITMEALLRRAAMKVGMAAFADELEIHSTFEAAELLDALMGAPAELPASGDMGVQSG